MSGGILLVITREEVVWHLVGKGQRFFQHPGTHMTIPTTENYMAQNVSHVKVRTLCLVRSKYIKELVYTSVFTPFLFGTCHLVPHVKDIQSRDTLFCCILVWDVGKILFMEIFGYQYFV